MTYTLAGMSNPDTGWGLTGESFNTLGALERFYGKGWFALGDRDLATHLFRTERLAQGWPLSRITAEIARRCKVSVRIMPMTDDRVRTFVKLRGRAAMPFQEYFVRNRARGRVEKIELRGIEQARPLPQALAAIRSSTAVILAPSNPFVSLGPILALTAMRRALVAAGTGRGDQSAGRWQDHQGMRRQDDARFGPRGFAAGAGALVSGLRRNHDYRPG